jgi:hypothetical protein
VEYGREILSGHHGHEYLELDVSQADDLDAAVSRAFGEDPLLGIGFVGLSYFFSDEEVRELARTLYSLSAPDSVLAMTFLYTPNEETAASLVAEYARGHQVPPGSPCAGRAARFARALGRCQQSTGAPLRAGERLVARRTAGRRPRDARPLRGAPIARS